MFTGITETIGKVESIDDIEAGSYSIVIACSSNFFQDLSVGSSVMVDGVCLSITENMNWKARFDIMLPTRLQTIIGEYQVGTAVNLERALPADGRLDGHFVLGHVDGRAKVIDWQNLDQTVVLTIEPCDTKLMAGIVNKGSVTLSGVSLTVMNITSYHFQVGLIPTTLTETTLSRLKLGNLVNIETDLLAKVLLKNRKGA